MVEASEAMRYIIGIKWFYEVVDLYCWILHKYSLNNRGIQEKITETYGRRKKTILFQLNQIF